MIGVATKVLRDYGKVLANIEPGTYGLPQSFLPHSKTTIREATLVALQHVGSVQPNLREALIRGYVYLAQFIPDEEAELLMVSGSPDDPEFDTVQGAAAMQIVNRIKVEMERSLEEIVKIR